TNTPSPTPPPTPSPPPVTPPAAGDWPSVLAYYRASARLPDLAENSGWSAGAFAHARYMVKNDVLSASETSGLPWTTDEGAAAAPNSNLLLSDNLNLSDRQALDYWMAKPFHALGLLDPALLTTGFGSFREDAGNFDPYKMGAAIDVRRGLGSLPPSVQFPIKWPEHNSTVYLTQYDGAEQPDPLSSCSGYTPPSGLPIILQLGPGSQTPVVTAHSLQRNGVSLAHCVFSETDYANSISNLQSLGRALLNASDAVILIPKLPLTAGAYTVSITANGQTATWTFNVAP
ncbi:MAG: CAP domain-containing protein, partial [Anaerolineales bacterium]